MKETSAMCSTTLLPTDVVFLELRRILAFALRVVGQFEESEALFHDVLLTMKQAGLPPDDGMMLTCMMQFAQLLLDQEKLDESEKMIREVVRTRSLSLGINDDRFLQSRFVLGLVLFHQGRYTESEDETREVWAAQTKLLGPDRECCFRILSVSFDGNLPESSGNALRIES